MDIIGPLPNGRGGKKFILVATDYFSKWIEAESYVNIKDTEVRNFIWKNIICRFGIPRVIIADNGSQFISKKIENLCREYRIEMRFSTPRHPQANGQAEASNKLLIKTLKRRLERAKGNWPDELPGVLWANRTTKKESTGETPYSLVYGVEAVIPAELVVNTFRTRALQHNNQPEGSSPISTTDSNEQNAASLHLEHDFLEEKRERANVRLAHYKSQCAKYYNSRVIHRRFQIGDLVLRKVQQNTQEQGAGKLGPNWEGPYKVVGIARTGSYTLEDTQGNSVPRNWHSTNLRKYFH